MALISCTLVETPLYCVKAKNKILCLETRNKNHCHSYVPRKHHQNSEIILIRCYLILCILRIGQSTHITNLKIQVSTKMSSLSNHEIWAHDFTVVEDNLYDSAWRQFVRQCSKTICTTVLEDNLYDSARRQFVRQCLKTICTTVLEDKMSICESQTPQLPCRTGWVEICVWQTLSAIFPGWLNKGPPSM